MCFSKTWTSVFQRNSRRTFCSFCRVRGKRGDKTLILSLPYPRARKTVTVVCVCFYSITLGSSVILLTTYLTLRPSVLSPPRSRLMAFENSNIIRRFDPSRRGTLGGSLPRRMSRILAIPSLLSKVHLCKCFKSNSCRR